MPQEPTPPPLPAKSGRFKTIVAWVCGPIVLLELAGVVWIVVLAMSARTNHPEYISEARLIAGGAEVNPKLPNGEPIPDSFYATNIEVVLYAHLQQRALNRARAKYPGMAAQVFKIEASRLPATHVVSIRAIAGDAHFAQAILESLLVEFFDVRKELRLAPTKAAYAALTDAFLKTEKEISEFEGKIKAADQGKLPSTDVEKAKAELEHLKDLNRRLFENLMHIDAERAKNGEVFRILEPATLGAEVRSSFPGNLFRG